MRVVLITQGVSRLVEPLFNSNHSVVGIVESMPRNSQSGKLHSFLFRLLRFFYKRFKSKGIELRSFCNLRNVPYTFISKGRDVEVGSWIEGLKPDLIVVFSMSQLIRQNIIDIPRYGVINMHPSCLPDYRGPNPDFWQYYDMEMNPGVTVHYIDAGEDTGDIILQRRIPIDLGEKSPAVLDRLIGDVGVSLLLQALDMIARGDAPRCKQPEKSPTVRARNLTSSEHGTIIDWEHWPIERIWHVLRGTESWLKAIPPPRGIYAGQYWNVEEFIKTQSIERPGTLLTINRRHCVAVKDGYIFLSCKFNLKTKVVGILQK